MLTAYSIRASFFAIHALMRDAFAGMGGTVESGELILRERSAGRALSTSLFSRWVRRDEIAATESRAGPGEGGDKPFQSDRQGHPRAAGEEVP